MKRMISQIRYFKPDLQKNMEKETETEAERETHLDTDYVVILSFQF